MTRFQRFRKAAALASAALMISAFVLYRAGFDAVFMTSSKSTFMFVGSSIKPTNGKQTPNAELSTIEHEAALQLDEAAPKPGE